ncbi:uncharacterized protein LOC143767805 [Ranitomeya variabilis]|uniref:uncharacterized protein LOC143767805 n=1 Tax=Ranitomeya variabilis TaxID=490064 RepID=UPI0040578786
MTISPSVLREKSDKFLWAFHLKVLPNQEAKKESTRRRYQNIRQKSLLTSEEVTAEVAQIPGHQWLYSADMAIIADDSPSKEKESSVDITVTANEPPANEGFCTDEILNVSQQPCTIEQDPDKEPLPPLEITSEPEASGLLPVETKVKKKRQRKRKSKKIKAVVLVKGPRPRPGSLSGKFHLTLPKKAVRNGFFFIALCSVLRYQLAQSAIICTQSVPVPNCPLTLIHNDQRYTFQNPTLCPENIHISDSCAACFEETSLLKIICNSAADIEIWGEPRTRHMTFIKITSEATGCNYFVNSLKLRRKRSTERSLGADLKGNRERSVGEKKGNLIPDTYDDEVCTITVPVTDFPIVIREDVHSDSLNEATFCPESVEVLKNYYYACFKNLTLLKISYRKNRNEDLESFWVEHGKGRGTSDLVDMNSAVCHKVAPDVSHIQSRQSDGGTSTENTAVTSAGNSQTDLRRSNVLVIEQCLIFIS